MKGAEYLQATHGACSLLTNAVHLQNRPSKAGSLVAAGDFGFHTSGSILREGEGVCGARISRFTCSQHMPGHNSSQRFVSNALDDDPAFCLSPGQCAKFYLF
jgi:hypothetical protein